VGTSERDERLRAAWRVVVAAATKPKRLVFVDEMGTNTSLAPLYAWSRRGERARFEVPRNWGANVSLLTSMSAEGMGPCLAVEGSTTRQVFESYLERVLGPSLEPGQVMVMDNLSSHKGPGVRELIEERGCELLCTCHPTRPISIPSRKRSPSSRRCCDRPGRVPARRS